MTLLRVVSFVDIAGRLMTSFGRLEDERSVESPRDVEVLSGVTGVAETADGLEDSLSCFGVFFFRLVGLRRASILSIAVFEVWQSSLCCRDELLLSDAEVERDDVRED